MSLGLDQLIGFDFYSDIHLYCFSDQRIIVKDLEEDLFDGQILGKLIEKLSSQKLDVVEVTQNEDGQRAKLRTVLDQANRLLGIQAKWGTVKWSVEGFLNSNHFPIA